MKEEKARKAEAEAVAGEIESQRSQLEHAKAQQRRAEEKLSETKENNAQKTAAQGRAVEATKREVAEYNEEIKAAIDQRRAADAEKMRLERQQESATARHSAEVAEMIQAMKHLAAAMAGYNSNVIANLATVEATEIAPDRIAAAGV